MRHAALWLMLPKYTFLIVWNGPGSALTKEGSDAAMWPSGSSLSQSTRGFRKGSNGSYCDQREDGVSEAAAHMVLGLEEQPPALGMAPACSTPAPTPQRSKFPLEPELESVREVRLGQLEG